MWERTTLDLDFFFFFYAKGKRKLLLRDNRQASVVIV